MQISTRHECVDGWPGVFPEGATRCGMCGDRLIRFDVSPSAVLLAIPSEGAPVPASLQLSAGRSLFDADLELSFNGEALAIDGESKSPMRVLLPADGQRTLTVQLAGEWQPLGESLSELVTIRLKDLDVSSKRVEVRIGRLPVIDAAELSFTNAIAGLTAEAAGQLQHHGGLELKVLKTRFEPELPGVSVSGLWANQGISSGDEVKYVVRAVNLPVGGLATTLMIDFDLGLPPLRIDVRIQPENADLRWQGTRTIFAGIDNELALIVSNSGRQAVTLERLQILDRPDWLRLVGVKLPMTVGPGAEQRFRVRVDGSHAALAGLKGTAIELTAVVTLPRVGERLSKHTIWVKAAQQADSWVGVDFGTTSSCISYWESRDKGVAGAVRMLDFGSEQHGTTVPSVAYFDQEAGRWLGGLDALEMAEERGDQDNLVRSVKRLLNYPPNSPDRMVLRANREFQPEEPATAILSYLRGKIEERLQVKLENVVLTHPANFSDTGIKALLRCAEDAGLKMMADEDGYDGDAPEELLAEDESNGEDQIRYRLDEPVAVAIRATQLKMIGIEDTELVLVYDFGGGTLDVSLLEVINRADDWRITVLSHRGANWLGGDDFTRRLMALAAERFAQEKGYSLQYDREELCKGSSWERMSDEERAEVQQNWRLLWDAAEDAKVRLSSSASANLSVSVMHNRKTESLVATIKSEEFEEAVKDLVESSLGVVKLAIESVPPGRRIHLDDVDVVIASGKTSRIPVVRRQLKELCGAEKVDRVAERVAEGIKEGRVGKDGFDVKECVAQGACDRCREDTTPLGVGSVGLKIFGLHQRTNCSYGIAKSVGFGAGQKTVFHPLVLEGILYKDAGLKVTDTVMSRARRQHIPLYQHTGDTKSPEALVIDGNPDVTYIDDIEVQMPPRSRDGKIRVSMWLGKDGLLKAEALAEGSEEVFRPKLADGRAGEKKETAQ